MLSMMTRNNQTLIVAFHRPSRSNLGCVKLQFILTAKRSNINLNRVKQLAPTAKIVSMVKANAYGHGVKAA